MELNDSRILVAGATGTLGGRLARLLAEDGASLALAGRDAEALATVASELGGVPTVALELTEPGSPAAAVAGAADALGGLDGLVVATGAVAFGTATELDDAVTRDLFAVNALGPIALVRAALERIEGPGRGRLPVGHRRRLPHRGDGLVLGVEGRPVGLPGRGAPRGAQAGDHGARRAPAAPGHAVLGAGAGRRAAEAARARRSRRGRPGGHRRRP